MIWNIKKRENILLYESDLCELKVIKYEKNTKIFLNYKGYNIIMPMGMWGFDEEISERNIKYSIGGEKINHWHYIINNDDLRLFIDLIYFFIQENDVDKMLYPDLLIEN